MYRNDPDLAFGLVLFVLLSLLGGLALSFTRNHRQTIQFQLKLFLIAFALRFIASVVIYQFGLVQVLGDEDASGWTAGLGFQQKWLQQGIAVWDLPGVLTGAFVGQHRGYAYMLGAFFFLTDAPARLPAAALNCFFGALTVVYAYRIAQVLFSEWVAVRVGWWACIFPSLIVWSAQTVKEPVIILLETVALYGCVHLKLSGFSLRYIILCALAVLLVIPFRFYAAYVAGAAVTLALLMPRVGRGKITVVSALALVALLIPTVFMSGVLAQHEAEFEKFNLQRIQRFRQDVAVGTGSGVETPYDLRTPTGFISGLGVGGAHLMLAPFPWQLERASLRMLLTLPELLVWWWLVFWGLLPGLWHAIKNRFNEIQPVLFFICGLGMLYSLMFGNIGLIYRQRAQLIPWLLIFAMVGLEQHFLRRLARRKAVIESPQLAEAGSRA